MRPNVIVDPAPHSVKGDSGRIPVRDRDMRAVLLSVKRDGASRRRRYIYDRKGEPLGVVTFEPCAFDTFTGKVKRT